MHALMRDVPLLPGRAVLQGGEPVAGAVVEFSGGPGAWVTKTYSAAAGRGATLNGSPISVSREADVGRSLLVGAQPHPSGAHTCRSTWRGSAGGLLRAVSDMLSPQAHAGLGQG